MDQRPEKRIFRASRTELPVPQRPRLMGAPLLGCLLPVAMLTVQSSGFLLILGCGLALVLAAVIYLHLSSEISSHSFRSMGGLATVTVGVSDRRKIDQAAERTRAIFERLEGELSAYRPGSVCSLLAEKAGVAPVAISEDARRVLELALRFCALSDGACDVTVAPLVKLWGFGDRTQALLSPPPQETIREQLELVDYRRVVLQERAAFLPVKGMALDLGGIAKGYAVDLAFEDCRSAGLRNFLIDLSGNIRVCGRPGWGKTWQIGVRDPFDRSRIIGRIALPSGLAVATSGNYERFVEIGGQRYSHIIDPRTGFPATGTAGVTVLCENATAADGLSTSLFIAGLEGLDKVLRTAPPAEVLMVPGKYPTEIWLSRGFAEIFTPIPELSDRLRTLPRA